MRDLVLILEEEPWTQRLLRSELKGQGYQVLLGQAPDDFAQWLDAQPPSLVVLAREFGAGDGLGLLRRIRQRSQVPVLMLAPAPNRQELLTALDLGADEYLAKPLDIDEFLARVRVLLRRVHPTQETAPASTIDLGGLTIDFQRHCLLSAGVETRLSRTECHLLYQLAFHLDRVVPHHELLSKVWGSEYTDDTHYLRTWVSQLRHKMGENSAVPRYLLTIPGVGYRLRRYPTVAS